MSLIPRVPSCEALITRPIRVPSWTRREHARDPTLLSFVSVRKCGRITRAYRATLIERNGTTDKSDRKQLPLGQRLTMLKLRVALRPLLFSNSRPLYVRGNLATTRATREETFHLVTPFYYPRERDGRRGMIDERGR